MDKKELQKKLSQTYTTANWKEVVQFVFPNVQLFDPPYVFPIDNKDVETFRQLGNVVLHDSKILALYELKLKKEVNILKSRVKLNELVSKYIDQDQNHGVLAIFEKGTDDFRFTFTARNTEYDEEQGDFKNTKTDNKRFTYVLGKNESCKTPAQRFFDLSTNKNKAEIKDIEDAFSVEKLSKLFFKEYKDQYNAFVNYMMQTPSIFTAIYSNDDKAIRDFVKILLGRIIFIKFVQKKGWMGVEAASTEWIAGDYRFLENGFTHFKHKDLFYSTFLEPLFDALDEPNRPNDIFNVTNSRVPYLSGGLFELEDKKTKNINFPAKYFNDLFEFLDRYNFTIDENDTNDHEVGIDPEMLGHIFENLLEDNKDKGAFYTPKEIVRYMCQESLKEYLKTSLENNNQWPTDATEAATFEQDLHNFVTKKEAGGIIEFEETIARALKEVKICDPAIGSGAFPMGLLNEIFQLVHKLHDANKDKVERVWELQGWQPNLVKQNIIQNSIYGVDIEKGAVDVARLRFWLSLIVDEPEPKALPHLEYKIVVGNSLVSKLDDTIIDIDWDVQNDTNLPETDLFGKPKPKQFNVFEVDNNEKQIQLLKAISTKQKAVFDPNSNEEKLSLEIRNLKIDLLVNQLDAMVKTKGTITEPKGIGKNLKAQTELWLQTIGWKQQIEKLKKLKKNPKALLHFFDWKLDFPEIMNEQVTDKLGFDIVIANPPYVDIKALPKNDVRIYFEKFKTTENRINLYSIFLEKSSYLLNDSGNLCFINPNSLLINESYKKIRTFLIDEVYKIIKLPDSIFETATVETMIIFTSKKTNFNNIQGAYFSNNDKINFNNLNFNVFFRENWKNDKDNRYNIFSNPITLELLTKIEQNSKNVDEYVLTSLGITPYDKYKGHSETLINNREFHSDSKLSVDYVPLISGKNIHRYHLSTEIKEYLKYGDWLGAPREDKFFTSPKIIVRQILSGRNLELISAYSEESIYFTQIGFSLISKNNDSEELKLLIGLINSKLLSYYHKNKFLDIEKIVFQKVLIANCKRLPIKNSNSLHKKKILKLVNEILNKSKKSTELEQEIDNLVYQLYELSYEEVLVVEPEFSERMSCEEYEDLKVE